jgi:molybdopterin converting factor small subunit
MKIIFKATGYYAEAVGDREVTIELASGVFTAFAEEVLRLYPDLEQYWSMATFMVNSEDVAQPDTVLSDGDLVYMLVPISGG